MIKQLHILKLIGILFLKLIRHGNVPVYYHCIGGKHENPIEAERVEMRKTSYGEKRLTIW